MNETGKATQPAEAVAPLTWYDGEPPFPQNQEWFIAETIYGDRVVLTALPEGHTYDYKTADSTYMAAKNVKRWMQFPDCEYIPPDTHPTLASASEPLQAMADNERELGLDYGLGASVAGAGEASTRALNAALAYRNHDPEAVDEQDAWVELIDAIAALAARPVADGEAADESEALEHAQWRDMQIEHERDLDHLHEVIAQHSHDAQHWWKACNEARDCLRHLLEECKDACDVGDGRLNTSRIEEIIARDVGELPDKSDSDNPENYVDGPSAALARQAPAPLRDPRMEKFDREGPLPGMIAAFELQFGQSWTDKDWRDEASTWARAWKAALATVPLSQAVPEGFPLAELYAELTAGYEAAATISGSALLDGSRKALKDAPVLYELACKVLRIVGYAKHTIGDALSRQPQPQAVTEDARDGERNS